MRTLIERILLFLLKKVQKENDGIYIAGKGVKSVRLEAHGGGSGGEDNVQYFAGSGGSGGNMHGHGDICGKITIEEFYE